MSRNLIGPRQAISETKKAYNIQDKKASIQYKEDKYNVSYKNL